MKAKLLTLLPALAALCLTTASLSAASFAEAKITRLEKDVKILKENAAPHAASVGENVNAVTSVATGASSRAELMFPDKSLTRLGANSRFTIRGQGHSIDLDKGVLLFEVPEKLRDAKVRTAAVTAAVTGGTLIFEYLPGGFIKIMCIEGTVDVSLNSDPSKFVTFHAGQMIIQPANATDLSLVVDFDLKRLLKTSKLISGEGDPNAKEISDAISGQQGQINDGNLVKTNLIIPGLGTIVQLNNDARFIVPPNPGPPATPPSGGAPGGGVGGTPPAGPVFQGVVPLITGLTVLNAHGNIKTDPKVTAFNVTTGTVLTSDGRVYNSDIDGPFPYFAFGSQIVEPPLKRQGDGNPVWAAYKFEKLLINGTPTFDFSGDNPVYNVILASVGNISLVADNQFSTGVGSPGESTGSSLNIVDTDLNSLMLGALNGSITLAQGFTIDAAYQNIDLVTLGTGSDITIEGDINILNGFLNIVAGQDLMVSGNVTADDITLRAGRDATIQGNDSESVVEAKKGNLLVSAKRNIKITNSAQLVALSQLSPEALLRLESLEGDIVIEGNSTINGTNIEIEAFKGNISITDSTLTATHALKARTMRPDGTLLIQNSALNGGLTASAGDLIRLYADGGNGKVLFQGNVTLNSDEVQIAGKTVQVDPGGNVNITQGNAHIFSDHHNYNTGSYGTIDVGPYGNLQQYNFNDAKKPDFNTGGKLGRPIR